MKKKKKYIKFKKERVILSDILPFEVPITFSNRHFYSYLLECNISIDRGKIIVKKKNTDINQTIIKLLFGIKMDDSFNNGEIKLRHMDSIPFGYKIVHKENDFRELSIIHPKNQLAIIELYDKYRELILYYSNISLFSIRKPYRIAKFTYFKDRLHLEKLAESSDEIIEQNDLEYENLKTFFVYKKYSNIHKFYESYQYHRCEKKFDHLFKFDISKCFDSIYTHSISWALMDKEVVKKYLYLKQETNTFSEFFDSLMQKLNYNETNGIVIGPEFSRIFAELILQRIDANVKKELEGDKLFFKKDFEIFRYVDDYFVFYNEGPTIDKIVNCFRLNLKQFNLYLSDSKTRHYEKPIITEITIAKQKINELFENALSYRTEVVIIEDEDGTQISKLKGRIYINSNALITKIKSIVFECKVDYKDILNYTFSIIERKLKNMVKTYFKIDRNKGTEKEFINAILESFDFIFFLYSVSPRVNTTVKLCRILSLVTSTLNLKNKFSIDFKHLVFKKIYDNVLFILHKNKSIKHTQVETLYLLIALGELGNKYWLTESVLANYLQIKKNSSGKFEYDGELNYFTIVVSLFYMKNKLRYDALRFFILEKAVEKFEKTDYEFMLKKAELTFLLFDLLTYSYTNITLIKRKLLDLYKVPKKYQTKVINARKSWFTIWKDFDFAKELEAKQSQEVY